MTGPVEVARQSWGRGLPDWVEALAEECAASSQNKVAKAMGYSAPVVSQVLHARYSGDLQAVEEVFRGVYQNAVVECPALGKLPAQECRNWRTKSRRFVGANTRGVTMYRACNRCPQNDRREAS